MINQLKFIAIVSIALLTSFCNNQTKSTNEKESDNKETDQLVNEQSSPIKYEAHDIVSSGFLDSSGNMWFTTLTEGVFRYDGKSFTNFNEKDGLCDNLVSTVIEDKAGVIWFGTASGLCSYNGKTFVNVTIPKEDFTSDWLESVYPVVNPTSVVSLIQDEKGVFWIGSNGAGVYRYDGENFTSFWKKKGMRMADGRQHNVISSIIEDNDGNIWFSSFSHGGVAKYDGKTFIDFGTEDGLGDDMISSSYKDKSGNLWFGTRDGGISRYNGETFETIYETAGPCENFMPSIFEDKAGQYWVASFDRIGVCWFDGENFTETGIKNSKQLKNTSFISEDKDGNVWFGGRYGMLWRYDGESLKDFTHEMRIE